MLLLLIHYHTLLSLNLAPFIAMSLIYSLSGKFIFCFNLCAAGYIGSVSFLNTVLEVVNKLRSINPKLTYGKFRIFEVIVHLFQTLLWFRTLFLLESSFI